MAKVSPNAAGLCVPMAITEDGWASVVEALQVRDGKPLQAARTAKVRDGVAIVPVNGPLSAKSNWMSDFFGSSTYEGIAKDVQHALDSEEVHSILLDIDSPGGSGWGCGELGKFIYAARSQKPIVAYVGGMMCSAAYWLGSAATEIVADPEAWVGSIGVRITMVDTSKMEESVGVKVYNIVSEQSPYKVADAAVESDRARVAATITDMAAVFVADVAQFRGVSSATVKAEFGKGDVLVGKAALKAGMVDRLGSFESTLASLAAPQVKGNRPMSKAKSPEAKYLAAKCDGCDRDMDDDDDVYCAACNRGSDAKALLDVTGVKSYSEAFAVVSAWKIAAEEVSALRETLNKQKADADAKDFDAAIADAKGKRLLAASDDHKRNKAALAFKGTPSAMDSLRSFLSAFDPLIEVSGSRSSAPSAAPAEPQTGASGVTALTDEEKRIADKFGLKHEAVLKNKARLATVAKAPKIQNENDDEEDAA